MSFMNNLFYKCVFDITLNLLE